jgi:hypothetical protein
VLLACWQLRAKAATERADSDSLPMEASTRPQDVVLSAQRAESRFREVIEEVDGCRSGGDHLSPERRRRRVPRHSCCDESKDEGPSRPRGCFLAFGGPLLRSVAAKKVILSSASFWREQLHLLSDSLHLLSAYSYIYSMRIL